MSKRGGLTVCERAGEQASTGRPPLFGHLFILIIKFMEVHLLIKRGNF